MGQTTRGGPELAGACPIQLAYHVATACQLMTRYAHQCVGVRTCYSESTGVGFQGDETVYFLDYTGPKGFARSVATSCKEVVVLDHHKTALEDLGGPIALPQNMKAVLDMNKSGATIAQTYFGISVVSLCRT